MQRFDIAVDGTPLPASGLSPVLAVRGTAFSSSWHAHDYRLRAPDRAPTSHLIRDILGLDEPRQDAVQIHLDRSSTCSARHNSASLVTSSSVEPEDERRFGSSDLVPNGLDWSTSGRRAGYQGNPSTTSSAADTTLRGQTLNSLMQVF